jgi:hypothetical protein
MILKKINKKVRAAEEIPALLEGEAFVPLAQVNWGSFPYRPEVDFRLGYTDEAILLHYRVKEQATRAKYGTDNDPVWTDSCVEFFLSPTGDDTYYNIECNAAGTLLIGVGESRHNREHAPTEVMQQVKRWASLGREPFGEERNVAQWELTLVVPFTAFFKHAVRSLEGKKLRGNFYKCGDELSVPHYVSWNPIGTEQPDFHRPEFFGELEFAGR